MQSVSIISRCREAASLSGLYTRVARKLNVSTTHVRHVALGNRKSDRVMKALAAEVARIDRARQREAAADTQMERAA